MTSKRETKGSVTVGDIAASARRVLRDPDAPRLKRQLAHSILASIHRETRRGDGHG